MGYALLMEGITKSYPGVKALDQANLKLKAGSVLGLVGENGAGKSTLIKIISGDCSPDSGKITIRGKEFFSMTPQKTIASGIAVIHQESNLVPALTVCDNIFLGRERVKNGFLQKSEMLAETQKVLKLLDINIAARATVKNLSVGFQQLVSIAKAVAQSASILVLDEPTASLSDAEVTSLFSILKDLKSTGVSMIYVSHRLEEIFEICDEITVLRDGKVVTNVPVMETSKDQLIEKMVGRPLGDAYPARTVPAKKAVCLQVVGLRGREIDCVNFSVHKGEILGFAGLVGAGRTEIVRALFGADKSCSESLTIDGQQISVKNPEDAIAVGMGFVPEDRKAQGLNLHASISSNIAITNLDSIKGRFLLSQKREDTLAERFITQLKIKTTDTKKRVFELSGGNQQKVVLAKWLAKGCRVLILDEPTKGIDVGSKQEIYRIIREQAASGVSVIFISSDLDELIGMADRIAVVHEHKIVKCFSRNEFSQHNILKSASGGTE